MVEIVPAGDRLENAAIVERPDDLRDTGREGEPIALDQNSLPQSVVEIPDDTFDTGRRAPFGLGARLGHFRLVGEAVVHAFQSREGRCRA